MAGARDIRRLSFQALYQLDARNGDEPDSVRASMDEVEGFTPGERDKAFATARAAFDHRAAADATMLILAPAWPASRQAAVDRAILRLAHYEMHHSPTPPKVVVNEAVELCKEFSTDRSPAFVNGLLDKVLKQVLAVQVPQPPTPAPDPTQP